MWHFKSWFYAFLLEWSGEKVPCSSAQFYALYANGSSSDEDGRLVAATPFGLH
jgi:hypothetical protein